MEELRQKYLEVAQQLLLLCAEKDLLLNELIRVYTEAFNMPAPDFDHEMVDGIGLWLVGEGSYQTCDQLEAMAAKTDDPALKKDLLEQSQAIENKCAAYCMPRNRYQQIKQQQDKQHKKTRK